MRNEIRAAQLNDIFDSWASGLPHSPWAKGDTFTTPAFRNGDLSVAPAQIASPGDMITFRLYKGTYTFGGKQVPCHVIGAEGLVVSACVHIDGESRPYFGFDGTPLAKEMLDS